MNQRVPIFIVTVQRIYVNQRVAGFQSSQQGDGAACAIEPLVSALQHCLFKASSINPSQF